ncbi:annexin A1-like [Megalops cyprinoides]|uniref:annexin A1-like n=1 Tax=Megalops cyprinoides TaxID=118141 RepID=UPI00186560E7|nr:annexin A1-like [Megalops cyprinoides]
MAFLKEFLRQLIHLDTPDEAVTTYQGTVTPYSPFSASHDAEILDKAIKAKGVDEATIMDLLVKRSNSQRQEIKAAYQQACGKALDAALASALRGDLEDLALALLRTPAQYDAQQMKKAMQGFGTNEDILIEILASRTNKEIRELKTAYKEEYQAELEDDIKAETSGDFRTALLSLCKASRSEDYTVNKALADSDAQALYEAGEKKRGTDCNVLIDILTTRSAPQLRRTFKRYTKYSKLDVSAALDSELQGDIEDCLTTIVKCAGSKSAFFAEKLHSSMKGLGTRTSTLIRVLVSRSEVDLKMVKEKYKRQYGHSLQQDIRTDVSGDLEAVLVALCGGDN